ncbi:MAG: DUF1444 family protein [Bacillaceae bacterium]|nr:DUF1444 family protein [Bacillaceae bacterium]
MTDRTKEARWKKQFLELLDDMIENDPDLKRNWRYEIEQGDEGDVMVLMPDSPAGKKEEEGLRVSLSGIYRQLDDQEKEVGRDQALKEVMVRIKETMRAGEQDKKVRRDAVYPVLRSASFPREKRDGTSLVFRKHTAESTIFYALDLGKSYALIDQKMLEESGLTEDELHEAAVRNLKNLDIIPKQDEVQGNVFYFFSQKDGYAASRVLNDALLKGMLKKVKGEMGVAIPHQDVLIVADLRNDVGYQILSKVNMDFCMKGDIPISPLPFVYHPDGDLEPVMIIQNPGKSAPIKRK